MNNTRLILALILATTLVGGSAVIIYRGRPVVVLREQQALDRAKETAEKDDNEDNIDDDVLVAETTGAAPATITPSTPVMTPTPAPSPAPAPDTYTLADVAIHATQADCWSTINGGVYDLTTWIDRHPGGPGKIIGLCGKDGSASFTRKHGEQSRPVSALLLLKIGTLR